jgi:hypothetical protein
MLKQSTELNPPTAEIYRVVADNQLPYRVDGTSQEQYDGLSPPNRTMKVRGVQARARRSGPEATTGSFRLARDAGHNLDQRHTGGRAVPGAFA